ncbi:hypothetical protein [Mycobacterium sp.]|uniref:phage holin family protein n=1 Tax=Mycobacterium sp. TaxID=1785 RepID=UPI00126D5962|nr:hypothetical protein [Mycobacterium sp.]KAA8958835.1 MAG: phage holin family protein [Mycobacterium sp.]
MLIVALVLAVIGLAALVFAVVTSNELVAWVCIAASAVGVLLLIVDSVRERQRRQTGTQPTESTESPEPADHDGPMPAPETLGGAADTDSREIPAPDEPRDAADEGDGATEEQVPVRSADAGSDDQESGA